MRHPNLPAAVAAVTLPLSLLMAGCGAEDDPDTNTPTPLEVATSACELTHEVPAGSTYFASYLPVWASDATYAKTAKLEGVNEVKLAFAIVEEDGTVSTDFGSAAAQQTFKTLAARADVVTLAVGGWGDSDEQHQSMLKGFDTGLKNPEKFAGQLAKAARTTAKVAGTKKVGINIDMEFPDDKQAAQMPALVDALHDEDIEQVSMAVGAGQNGDSMRKVARKLAGKSVTFDLMTYDYNGPWSQTSGPNTEIRLILNEVGAWVKATGAAEQVAAGIPAYGHDFVGATGPGMPFDQAKSATAPKPLCTDVKPDSLVRDPDTLTTGALTKDGWTSIVTPDDAADIAQRLRQEYPGVTTFTWELNGTPQDMITALKQD